MTDQSGRRKPQGQLASPRSLTCDEAWSSRAGLPVFHKETHTAGVPELAHGSGKRRKRLEVPMETWKQLAGAGSRTRLRWWWLSRLLFARRPGVPHMSLHADRP